MKKVVVYGTMVVLCTVMTVLVALMVSMLLIQKVCIVPEVLTTEVVTVQVPVEKKTEDNVPDEDKTFAATATMVHEGEVLYDYTCLWYHSDGQWHAIILSGTEIIDRRYYKTQEELVEDVREAYAEIPMDKKGEVTAETIR